MILTSEADARKWFAERPDVDALAMERLERLARLLRDENARQNLVSARSLETVWLRHFADSAQLLNQVSGSLGAGPWLDLGSGAGFPGLVIAICRPESEIVVVESRTRRTSWLERAKEELALPALIVRGSRLQALESFAARVISARAFAPLAQLVALSARFSTPQTRWVLPKGRGGGQELLEIPKSIQAMFHVEHSITASESVILVGQGSPSTHRRSRT